MTNPHLTTVGAQLNTSEGDWNANCGDRYVSQIQQGAKLFFSIRVDFQSVEEKKAFEAKFSISGPLYSANTNLTQASREFSQNTKVIVTAFQEGGDVSKLTGVFSNSAAGGTDFVQCTLGSFDKCAAVIQAAILYASDTVHGFPSQIAPGAVPGPAPLIYTTSDYAVAGVVHPNYPFLAELVGEARHQLEGIFEDQFKIKIDVDRLLELGLGQDKVAAIQAQQTIVNNNLGKIVTVSKTCYDTPVKCPDAVNSLVLGAIDNGVIALPPLPKGSFRFLTTERGLWSRADSINFAMTPDPAKGGSPPYGVFAVVNEKASIVLLLEGVGLQTAKLMFEDTSVSPEIPLAISAGHSPEKASDSSALLVIETTRGNPGWQDIDIASARANLWKSSMPRADGTFYVLVKDAFGRSARFDIDYENWTRITAPIVIVPVPTTIHVGDLHSFTSVSDTIVSGCTVNESLLEKNRWWESTSGGTDVSGTRPFTSTVTGNVTRRTPGVPCN